MEGFAGEGRGGGGIVIEDGDSVSGIREGGSWGFVMMAIAR